MKRQLLILFLLSLSAFSIHAQTWSPVGAGLNNVVYALDTIGGNLYAGGAFDSAGGKPANYIAEWNGTSWFPLGKGVSNSKSSSGTEVNAITSFNGKIVAGGLFDSAGGQPATNIAMWNGTIWSSLGKGINGPVYALIVYNGNLYAGGSFDSAGGVLVNNIAMWNGSAWSNVGGGIRIDSGATTPVYVYAFCGFNGRLYVGGIFDSAGNAYTRNIAAWDGAKWYALDSGVYSNFSIADVAALATYDYNLYAAGVFNTASGVHVANIAEWDGVKWKCFGHCIFI